MSQGGHPSLFFAEALASANFSYFVRMGLICLRLISVSPRVYEIEKTKRRLLSAVTAGQLTVDICLKFEVHLYLRGIYVEIIVPSIKSGARVGL